MAKVYKRASAKRDLVAHYVYLTEYPLRSPALVGLRKWRVTGFEKFLIFYLPRPDGVSIVRVLHAAQDWWSGWGSSRDPTSTRRRRGLPRAVNLTRHRPATKASPKQLFRQSASTN